MSCLQGWPGYKHVFTQIIEALMQDENVDILLTVIGVPTLKTIANMVKTFPEKPVVAWVIGADQDIISEKARSYDFVPVYNSPDRVLYALKMVREYYARQSARTHKLEFGS